MRTMPVNISSEACAGGLLHAGVGRPRGRRVPTTSRLRSAGTGAAQVPLLNPDSRYYRRQLGGERFLVHGAVYAGTGAKLGASVCHSALARTVRRVAG